MRVPAFDTNIPGPRDAQAQPAAIYRMKVIALVNAISPAGGKVLKCSRYDGVNTGTRSYMVAPIDSHGVGDDLYVVMVSGKTAWTYTGSTSAVTRHVVFIEYPLLLNVLRVCGVASNTGSFGDASNRATLTYDVTPYGGTGGTIAANLSPFESAARIYKQGVIVATVGTYFMSGSNVLLYSVNELADQELC